MGGMKADSIDELFNAKDQPLREDVRLLGSLLGEVLKEQGGDALFQQVEAVRKAARRYRQGEAAAEDELHALLKPLDADAAATLVRAFSAYFFVVNMAERIHRLRRAVNYRREQQAQPGSWEAVIDTLAAEGMSPEALQDCVAKLKLCPVFTAHPTEATRRSLLVKEQRIARALMDRLSFDADPAAIQAQVRNEITTAWQTEEQLSVRPSVADEVEHVLFYLSEVIYRVVPRVYGNLEAALKKQGALAEPVPAFLSFGSWVGGDMDGNPNVGAHTIRDTLARHQELCLKKYRAEVTELFGYLTQSTSLIEVEPEVLARIEDYRKQMPGIFAEIPERYHQMPYRLLLWFMARRLDAGLAAEAQAYADVQELLGDLRLILRSLEGHKGKNAGAYRVRRLLRRVETFGFHLATLDVRQHADVHRHAAGQVLGVDNFAGLDSDQRTQHLQQALQEKISAPEHADEKTANSLEVMRAIAGARQQYGDAAVGLYIISMARAADDALAVLALARAADARGQNDAVALDIAPLFETVDDLANARSVLETLWADDLYREHLRRRGDVQYVMLGYSDSNKDSGLASSRWALHLAQREILDAAARAGLGVTLFHGRGGTISRGGGKPREAILAEPPGAINGCLRLTEQGEIIHGKYGLRGLGVRTLELMGGAVLERLGPGETAGADNPHWFAAMRQVAEASRRHYRGLVYEHPDFLTYFREATPIDVIERMTVGSRPSRRSGQAGIEDLRAIPWVFSWTQSRHLLPGWFGVGAGLEAAEAEVGIETLREMSRQWYFFNNLLSDAEMGLAKADLDIARRYAGLCTSVGASMFSLIEEEYERTRRMICRIRETDALLGQDAVLRRALELRNPYVDPMSLVQVELLRRWRQTDRQDDALERALLTTVHGIARGMQNTG